MSNQAGINFPHYKVYGLVTVSPILSLALVLVVLAGLASLLMAYGLQLFLSGYLYFFLAIFGGVLWFVLDWLPIKKPIARLEGNRLRIEHPSDQKIEVQLDKLAGIEIYSQLHSINFVGANKTTQNSYAYEEVHEELWIEAVRQIGKEFTISVLVE